MQKKIGQIVINLLEHYDCLFSAWHVSNRPIYEFSSPYLSRFGIKTCQKITYT